MLNKSKELWNKLPEQEHTREFIKWPYLKLIKDLLIQNMKNTRVLVGPIRFYYRLNKYMHKIRLAEKTLCLLCQKEKEIAVNIMCSYECLARVRFLPLGEEKPTATRYS